MRVLPQVQNLICALLLCLCSAGSPQKAVAGGGAGGGPATQMRSWVFPLARLNFASGSAVTTAALPSPAAPNNVPDTKSVAASAFDQANNLLFYLDLSAPGGAMVLRDANGVNRGVLNNYTSLTRISPVTTAPVVYGIWGTEMAVVPVPGACRQFYLLYTQASPNGEQVLLRAIVDCSGATPFISSQAAALDENNLFNFGSGIAVSKTNASGVRYLYFVGAHGVRHYSISSSGIGAAVSDIAGSNLYGTLEADLSPDGSKLAWTDRRTGSAMAYVASVNPSTGNASSFATPYSVAGASWSMSGLEFSSDSKKLFTCGYNSSNNNIQGVYVIDATSPTSVPQLLSGGGGASGSQLELGYDGLIYGIDGSTGRLLTINPNTNAVTLSANTTVFASNLAANTVRGLPDQIDGEDYTYFFGSPATAIRVLGVDDVSPTMTLVRNVYNCNVLELYTVIDNATSYRLTIQSALADGTITSAYAYSTGWVSSLPAEIKSLNNNYLATNLGIYKITVEARGICPTPVQRAGLIRVNALTPASAGFTFNACNGTSLTPSNNPAAPTVVGAYGGAINITFSTGTYDSYQVRFERYDNGTYTPVGTTTPPQSSAGGSLNSIGLNGLATQADLGQGYFAPGGDGAGKIFRLTLWVTNKCGTSPPVTGIFTPTDLNCRGVSGTGSSTLPQSEAVVFPNPVGGEGGQLRYELDHAQPVTLRVVDAITGQTRLTLLQNQWQASGTHVVPLQAGALLPGLYYYQLVTDRVSTGSFRKTI